MSRIRKQLADGTKCLQLRSQIKGQFYIKESSYKSTFNKRKTKILVEKWAQDMDNSQKIQTTYTHADTYTPFHLSRRQRSSNSALCQGPELA